MPEPEHDPALIQRLASVHEGNALARLNAADNRFSRKEFGHADRTLSQETMIGASGLVIAASYWSLIEPTRALALYRQATPIYQRMGHSYWMVLALASGSQENIPDMQSAIDPNPERGPQSVAFAMIMNEVVGRERRNVRAERLNAAWRHLGNAPVGRLGIPLDHYGNCAVAMHLAREERNGERFSSAATNYIHRASEAIRAASHDSYHWKQLQSAILPAEPEAVAMTVAMSMLSHQIFRRPLREMPDVDHHGRLLIEVGEEMRKAAQRGDRDFL